jgi:hypothetical protein
MFFKGKKGVKEHLRGISKSVFSGPLMDAFFNLIFALPSSLVWLSSPVSM